MRYFHLGISGNIDIISRNGTVLPDIDRRFVLLAGIIDKQILVRAGFFACQLVDSAIKQGFVIPQNNALQGMREAHGGAVLISAGALRRNLDGAVTAAYFDALARCILPDVNGSGNIRRAVTPTDEISIRDGRLLLRRQNDIAARTCDNSCDVIQVCTYRISGIDFYQILEIKVLRALQHSTVLDIDDPCAQHNAAMGINLPAYVNRLAIGISLEVVNSLKCNIIFRIV